MNLFENALNLGLFLGRRRYIPKNRREESISEFIQFTKHTDKCLKIVAGELDPGFYERTDVIESFEEILSKNRTIKILFHREQDMNRVLARIKTENKKLYALKQKYGDSLQIYWSPLRPESHYATVDQKHLFFEGYHKENEPRDTYFRYNSKETKTFFDKFDTFLGKDMIKKVL